MLPWSAEFAGRIDEHILSSDLLRGNPLGDPHERPLEVYVPPGYDEEPERRYPSVYVIQGYTGQLPMWHNRAPWRPTFPELADQVFARGEAPPVIVVYVDAWTSVGGSQFLDSPGTGRYHSYLCDEVVPYVDARYRTLASRDHRAISGKSSGGYGAMITPMLRPDVFGALATHAGDALFDVCYRPHFPKAARQLRDSYDGSVEAFLADFRGRIMRHQGHRPPPDRAVRLLRGLLRRRGRHRTAALRRHRQRDPRGLGALAGLGPRADGRAPRARRGAAVAARHLDRQPAPAMSTTSTSAR